MSKTISIGNQGFEDIRINDCFYIDKTLFIREWWESKDIVTLITRPRRFGKTLNMDMLKCFFSNKYAGRKELFEGLNIWKYEYYKKIQGTYPVIFLSFADVKERSYKNAIQKIKTFWLIYTHNLDLLKHILMNVKKKHISLSVMIWTM